MWLHKPNCTVVSEQLNCEHSIELEDVYTQADILRLNNLNNAPVISTFCSEKSINIESYPRGQCFHHKKESLSKERFRYHLNFKFQRISIAYQ